MSTIADVTLPAIASILTETLADLERLYPTRNFLLQAWSTGGQDGAPGRVTPLDNRVNFDGSNVRIPVDLNLMEGGGWVAEGGSVNVPVSPTIKQATVTLKKFVQPFGISLEAMEDSVGSHSAIEALGLSMEKASQALADRVNIAMNGGGLADLFYGNNAASSLTMTPLTTGANAIDWDRVYPGLVVDLVDATTGTAVSGGLRRRVASYVIGTPVITFDTAAVTSEGGSGPIAFTTNTVAVVPGSVRNVASAYTSDALQGGIQAAVTANPFQGLSRTTYPQWAAIDGRAGVTTVTPFSDGMVDTGITLGQRAGDGLWDFAIGDPNSINVYKNQKQSQVRYQVATGTVQGRFSGVVIDAGNQQITIVPERKFKPGAIAFLRRDAATLYGRKKGPAFDDITGSQFKQLGRATSYEVWMLDRIEWGWHSPNTIVQFSNLSTQSSVG